MSSSPTPRQRWGAKRDRITDELERVREKIRDIVAPGRVSATSLTFTQRKKLGKLRRRDDKLRRQRDRMDSDPNRPNPRSRLPGTTVRGWVKARAVKIVRNKRGQAVSVKIRT